MFPFRLHIGQYVARNAFAAIARLGETGTVRSVSWRRIVAVCTIVLGCLQLSPAQAQALGPARASIGTGEPITAISSPPTIDPLKVKLGEQLFDRWLAGDATALSTDELDGYDLFKSPGCGSCHQGVNIGGNLFQRHGIFHPLVSPDPAILRVPSLRNVATTPPYFQDGSAPTLDDAVRKMGKAQLNTMLTDPQVTAIVAFLHSLTGNYRGKPVGAAP